MFPSPLKPHLVRRASGKPPSNSRREGRKTPCPPYSSGSVVPPLRSTPSAADAPPIIQIELRKHEAKNTHYVDHHPRFPILIRTSVFSRRQPFGHNLCLYQLLLHPVTRPHKSVSQSCGYPAYPATIIPRQHTRQRKTLRQVVSPKALSRSLICCASLPHFHTASPCLPYCRMRVCDRCPEQPSPSCQIRYHWAQAQDTLLCLPTSHRRMVCRRQ